MSDSFNIRHAGVANEDTGVHVQSSLVCHSKEIDDSFDMKNTPSGILDTITSFKPSDLNAAVQGNGAVLNLYLITLVLKAFRTKFRQGRRTISRFSVQNLYYKSAVSAKASTLLVSFYYWSTSQ